MNNILRCKEIYSELEYMINTCFNYKKRSDYIVGSSYLSYKDNGKIIMSIVDKKSIENKIKVFNEHYYILKKGIYDITSNTIITNPSLEQFLDLPKELNIDYNKEILEQIKFEPYFPANFEPNSEVDRILKNNYLVSNGYIQLASDFVFILINNDNTNNQYSYLQIKIKDILHYISCLHDDIDESIEDLEETEYKKTVDEIENNDVKRQEEIEKFCSQPVQKQLRAIYFNMTNDELKEFSNKFDKAVFNLYPTKENEKSFLNHLIKIGGSKLIDYKTHLIRQYEAFGDMSKFLHKIYTDATFDINWEKWDTKDVEFVECKNKIIEFINKYLENGHDKNIIIQFQKEYKTYETIYPIIELAYMTNDKDIIKRVI